MLISKVSDSEEGKRESVAVPAAESDSQHHYETANELFEFMAQNQNFNTGDMDKLTTRDLVILYKNIDLGTKLMSEASELRNRKSNQHVESVVHKDEAESDGSDSSDIYSSDDLASVYLINKEKLDLISSPLSAENTLCQKIGGLEMHTLGLTTEYDKHFLFKDPYINKQLTSMRFMNNASDTNTVLPTSLLDYICCKRLEDNYNFYMDNIIRYVKHTIEQLKRISNGDYLTEKVKEKWREVESTVEDNCHVNTKVLATSSSIPMHVERKIGRRESTWDDIVHSAMDIRSLTKILEKRIIVEVPKLICGSYKLLSKCCAENLIIRCKKEKRPIEDATNAESRMDVVFQLQRSETGQVVSKISSIMILKTSPTVHDPLEQDMKPLALPYNEESNKEYIPETTTKIVELEPISVDESTTEISVTSEYSVQIIENPTVETVDIIDCGYSDHEGTESSKNSFHIISSDSSDALKDILCRKVQLAHREKCGDVFPDDLRFTIQKLTMQSALTEESAEDVSYSTKKKSPTRVRIKSPYENQSLIMEEKKRRKLLEIRERRERKKMALAENCKLRKHRFGKGAVMPQSVSSVTKLSISNKSFYNSIYGQLDTDPRKQTKARTRRGSKRNILDIDIFERNYDTTLLTPEQNSNKYTSRSYDLDDTVTEMMYINMIKNETEAKDVCSTSTSVISSDFRNSLKLFSQLNGPSETDQNIINNEVSPKHNNISSAARVDEIIDKGQPKILLASPSILKIDPSNSPNVEEHDNSESKKLISSLECRKSIDKIYNLMKELETAQNIHIDSKSQPSNSKYISNISEKGNVADGRTTSTYQTSDSGTSLKDDLTSSNPSSLSCGKYNMEKVGINTLNYQSKTSPSVVPKVIISSKSFPKTDPEKPKKERKRLIPSPTIKIADNPLKAISQLLHEFENVQKVRQKSGEKSLKKMEEAASDGKTGSRQSSFKRRSRLDQHNDTQPEKSVRITTPKDKKPTRSIKEMEVPKIPHQQIPVYEKDKLQKKKISDLLDEAKEARGEAVRGPSKLNSRLNSLAQPKKTYVQAHSEEYQTKYGKTLMANRLQRLAVSQTQSTQEKSTASANSRIKIKRGSEAISTTTTTTASMKQSPSPTVPPIERAYRARHSSSSSPETKERLNQGVGPCKQIIVSETPQTLKKKTVVADSCVKSHYGRTTSTAVGNEFQSVRKSRIPRSSNDIDLASSTSSPNVEGSTEVGSRLHHIKSIINSNTQALEILTECHETNSKIRKGKANDYSVVIKVSRCEQVSSDSEYAIDVLDDNNVVTSVERVDKASENIMEQINVIEPDATECSLQPLKSVTELEKLQNALCQHISVGAFQKRLRLQKLTLTPKQSEQPVLVLQSGDAASLVVQTPLRTNLKESKESLSDISTLPVLSKTHLDWSFANFPLRISTVGYAFPEYESKSLVKLFTKVSKKKEKVIDADHRKQCFEGMQPQDHSDNIAQVVPNTLLTVGISNSQVLKSDKKEEINQDNMKNIEHLINENETIKNTPCNELTQKIGAPPTIEKKESDLAKIKPDDIEYSTSLDILVGLLNEIQNITTCQTLISDDDKIYDENQQKELQTILNKAAALENSINSPCDAISFTSLDRLRQLESSVSLYSFYLSDCDTFFEKDSSKFNFTSEIMEIENKRLLNSKRLYVDKEVGVDMLDKEVVNKCTDVPSEIIRLGMNQSTDMTNSLIEVLREPSNQSVFSFAEYHSIYSDGSSLTNDRLTDIPQIIVTREFNQSVALYEVNNKPIEKPNANKLFRKKIESFKIETNKKSVKEKVNKANFRLKTEFDPIMKMKRDILVTVYSILVFTVFAALSFPEMYRV
ncbi:hypothetical protein HF086_014932 [Spodoptera exigua]|uniref:Uncharacterized protein n=1 Tax=Spodoptera exigua TaxID=7107 RepID=A0A922SHM9_SPOEX|nr:hypothetical protein HF086_014932 [Spodoptera exigua]